MRKAFATRSRQPAWPAVALFASVALEDGLSIVVFTSFAAFEVTDSVFEVIIIFIDVVGRNAFLAELMDQMPHLLCIVQIGRELVDEVQTPHVLLPQRPVHNNQQLTNTRQACSRGVDRSKQADSGRSPVHACMRPHMQKVCMAGERASEGCAWKLTQLHRGVGSQNPAPHHMPAMPQTPRHATMQALPHTMRPTSRTFRNGRISCSRVYQPQQQQPSTIPAAACETHTRKGAWR